MLSLGDPQWRKVLWVKQFVVPHSLIHNWRHTTKIFSSWLKVLFQVNPCYMRGSKALLCCVDCVSTNRIQRWQKWSRCAANDEVIDNAMPKVPTFHFFGWFIVSSSRSCVGEHFTCPLNRVGFWEFATISIEKCAFHVEISQNQLSDVSFKHRTVLTRARQQIPLSAVCGSCAV